MKVILAFLVNTLCNFAIGLLVAKFLGPAEFGRFALTLAVGMVLQIAFLDWARLAAIRFYSERARQERPELRATLDVTFAIISGAVAFLGLVAMLSGFGFELSNDLLGLAVGASITNGLFDYHTALVRARFHDVLYGRLVLTKNLFAFLATAGGAWLTGSALVAVGGVCLSMAGSVLIAREELSDPPASPALARRSLAKEYMTYALPIVAANLLYLLIALINRTLITRWYGFAETGQFSLAFDLGTRMVSSIGTMLDVLLFQIAVRAEETHGIQEGRMQVARNMGIVLTVLLPTCAGIWLILPSLERIIVPAEFRGPFEHYFSLLLIGLFSSGMIIFAVNPVFQIVKRTAPMIGAAVVAFIADPLIISVLPKTASSIAMAQSGAMLAGLVALTGFAVAAGAHWPRLRDVILAVAATAAMLAAGMPLRAWTPGVLTMAAQVSVGLIVYGGFVALFDMAGLREIGLRMFAAVDARVRARSALL